MSIIRILPEAVANKIAAGEVVERPASVVKELIENSLDAGADRVEVLVEAGGKRLVRVVDDGSGMTHDDALLAFDREIFKKISGTTPPERPFELAPAFYYPSEELLKQWKGRPLPNQGYIEE